MQTKVKIRCPYCGQRVCFTRAQFESRNIGRGCEKELAAEDRAMVQAKFDKIHIKQVEYKLDGR